MRAWNKTNEETKETGSGAQLLSFILWVLFHFVWVIRKLDNFEEHSGMDEATSEDLALPSRP